MSGYALALRDKIVAVVEQEGEFDESLHGASFTSAPDDIPDPDEYIYYDSVIHDPELKFEVGEIFTGELYESKYPPSIEELRRRISDKLHSKSIELINSDFVFHGVAYQAGESDRGSIFQKLIELLLDESITEVKWIAKDNSFTMLSREDFIALGKALNERTEAIAITRRAKKNELTGMSYEELENYKVDYGPII